MAAAAAAVVVGAGEGDEREWHVSVLEWWVKALYPYENCPYPRLGSVLDADSLRDHSPWRAHAELIYLRRYVKSLKAPAV